MSTIGVAWKQKDKNGNPYISTVIDEALLPLTIDSNKRIALYPVKEKKNDKSPDFRIELYIPKDKEENEELMF